MSHDFVSWVDQVARSGAPTAHYYRAQPLFIARPELLVPVCSSLTWEDGCRLLRAAAQEQLVPSEAFLAVQKTMLHAVTQRLRPVSHRAALGLLPLWAAHQVPSASASASVSNLQLGITGNQMRLRHAAVSYLPAAAFVNAVRVVAESPAARKRDEQSVFKKLPLQCSRWRASLTVMMAADTAGLVSRSLLLYTALACAKSAASVDGGAVTMLQQSSAPAGPELHHSSLWQLALKSLQLALSQNDILTTESTAATGKKSKLAKCHGSTQLLLSSESVLPRDLPGIASTVLAVVPIMVRPRVTRQIQRVLMLDGRLEMGGTVFSSTACPAISLENYPSAPALLAAPSSLSTAHALQSQAASATPHEQHHLTDLLAHADCGRWQQVLSTLFVGEKRDSAGLSGTSGREDTTTTPPSVNVALLTAMLACHRGGTAYPPTMMPKLIDSVVRCLLKASYHNYEAADHTGQRFLPERYILPFLHALVDNAEREEATMAFIRGEDTDNDTVEVRGNGDDHEGGLLKHWRRMRSFGMFQASPDTIRAVAALLRRFHTIPYGYRRHIARNQWEQSLALLTALGSTTRLPPRNSGGDRIIIPQPTPLSAAEVVLTRQQRRLQYTRWLDQRVLTDLVLMCSHQGCPQAALHLIGAARENLDVTFPSVPTAPSSSSSTDGCTDLSQLPPINPASFLEAMLFCQAYGRAAEACAMLGRLLVPHSHHPLHHVMPRTAMSTQNDYDTQTCDGHVKHDEVLSTSSIHNDSAIDYNRLYHCVEQVGPAIAVAWETARESGRQLQFINIIRKATGGGFPRTQESC